MKMKAVARPVGKQGKRSVAAQGTEAANAKNGWQLTAIEEKFYQTQCVFFSVGHGGHRANSTFTIFPISLSAFLSICQLCC